MKTLLVSLLLSFLASLWMTPLVRRQALLREAGVDASHAQRKIHTETIPRLGGIAIVLGFYAPLLGLVLFSILFYETGVAAHFFDDPFLAIGLLGGGAFIAALGMYDDLRGASPKLKVAVQLLVAVGLVAAGFEIERIDLPFVAQVELGPLAIPVTIVWIVGITNAINLIDGLDGLAAGMVLAALAPMLGFAIWRGNLVLALILCALVGSVLGFLVYNWHPARIFMGDTGSMFLGFIVAAIGVQATSKHVLAASFAMPVLLLGLPILDTFLAMGRRAWAGRSMFEGDRQHLHHLLMESGLSHRGSVLFLYGVAGVFSITALLVQINRDVTAGLAFITSGVVIGMVLRRAGYLKMPEAAQAHLQLAAARRAQNRAMRDNLGSLEESMTRSTRLEETVAISAELAVLVNASWAELTLPSDSGPTRSWSWSWDARARDEGKVMRFPLVAEEVTVGTLTLGWVAGDLVDEQGVVQTVESGCRAFAMQLQTLRPATAEEARSAVG